MLTSVGRVAPGKHGNGLQGVLYSIFTQGAPAGESLNGIGMGDPLPPVTEKFV